MRKKLLFYGAAILIIAGFLTNSCKEDDTESCADLLSELLSTKRIYLLEISYNNCVAYKNAMEDYINCDGVTEAEKEIYQTAIDNLDCSLE